MLVFISYRHLDQDFALRLVDTLRGWGHTPWSDCEHVSPGGDWVEVINQGLQAASVIVGVLSDSSVESKMVLREWLYALENRIPLLLVRLRLCRTPYPFNSIQYIDCSMDEATGFALLEKGLQSPKPEDFERLFAAKPAVPKTIESAKQRVTNRAAMLNKVYDFWIKGVLEPAKIGDVWLDLPAEQRPQAVQPEVKRNLHNPDFDSFSLGSGAKIVDMFRRMGNELLILGAPGSGKTITLLELARDLIAQAQANRDQPIPVVLNLSSWAEKHPEKLEDWLIERLFLDYGVPRKLGPSWIENGDLLFLFDGLDEVAEDFRDACVTAINTFWHKYDQVDNGIAVCSRIADYEKLTTSLHLENAILLDALTPAQADNYLRELGRNWDELRAAIPNDAVLRRFAESPLMLNIMAVAYHNISREQIIGLRESDQKRQLFDHYVVRRLREDKAPEKYPTAKTLHYLAWLAQKMVAHQQSVFQIEGLQPDWFSTNHQRQHYRREIFRFGGLFGGLAGTLFCAVPGGLIGGLSGGVVGAVPGGLVGALVGALVVGLVGSPKNLISSIDRVRWSWKDARNGLLVGLGLGLGVGLGVGLLVGGGLLGLLPGGLSGGLLVGLGVVLVGAFGGALAGGLTANTVEQRVKPNQGIYRSARNGLVVGLGGALVGGLGSALIGGLGGALIGRLYVELFRDPDGTLTVLANALMAGLISALFGMLIAGLGSGLGYGGTAVIRHIVLRRILAQSGVTPLNYAEFLDYCVSRQLLRRVGGGYIFRHRMLMEHFAQSDD